MAAFSYRNPPKELDYQELLRRMGVMFIRYRLKAWEGFASKPLNKQFEIWWHAKGPTGFRTTEDSFRFRRELFAVIERMIQGGELGDEGGNADDSGQL